MKLTESKLRQIIAEEFKNILCEEQVKLHRHTFSVISSGANRSEVALLDKAGDVVDSDDYKDFAYENEVLKNPILLDDFDPDELELQLDLDNVQRTDYATALGILNRYQERARKRGM